MQETHQNNQQHRVEAQNAATIVKNVDGKANGQRPLGTHMKNSNFVRYSFWGLIIALMLAVVACSPTETSTPEVSDVYTVVSEGTLSPGDAIPAPEGDVILTVTGNIGTTNVGDTIEMDLATIELLDQVDYNYTEVDNDVSIMYRGPLMTDLLALWQVPEDATQIRITALDGYNVNVPIAELNRYPVFFAIKTDGEYTPISTRGPAQLVWPYSHFDFEEVVYNEYWIWQIQSIEVQ